VLLLSSVHSLVSPADSFTFVATMVALNALVQSGTWTSVLKFVALHFRVYQFGRVVTVVGTGARLGAILSNVYVIEALWYTSD
jgi:sugar phosphate permease